MPLRKRHVAASAASWVTALPLWLSPPLLGASAAQDYLPCSSLQPLPLPGAAFQRLERLGADEAVAHYTCFANFTVDGTPGGETALTVACRGGHFRYEEVAEKGCAPAAGDEEHCWNFACRRGQPCRVAGAWLHESLDTSDCADGKVGGQSCVVRCAKGYYQPSHGRYEAKLDLADQVPVVLVCNNGTFAKLGSNKDPPKCVKADDVVREFDVYALLSQNEAGDLLYPTGGSGELVGDLPSNIDIFDLESLLAHLYTEVHAGQQQLADIKELFRDKETGRFFIQHDSGEKTDYIPQLPVYRDAVNTVVWYRLQVKLPPGIKLATNYEFGTFASFQLGKATNEAAIPQYQQYGGVVGLNQQQYGLIRMYEVTQAGQEAGATPALCSKESYRKSRPSFCKVVFNARSDPRYAPVGRFNSFSLPGHCPDRTILEKQTGDSATCLKMSDGSDFEGGLCAGTPDGSPACTYSLQEVARVPLDSITGITKESCGFFHGACKDLRDFQLNCADKRLRRGVKISSEERECVEYAVLEETCAWNCFSNCTAVEKASGSSGVAAYDVDGQAVECQLCQADGEASVAFFQGRCDASANEDRLDRLRRTFLQVAQAAKPAPPEIVQDCSLFKDCKSPVSDLGLGYCERDDTGICSPCYISGTKKFDPKRAAGLTPCRTDLFTSGGYAGGKGKPKCGSKEESLPCHQYLMSQREAEGAAAGWQPAAEWSACSTACGQGFRSRAATCPTRTELGDCRREIGDPEQGYCTDGQCFAIEDCSGQRCPWAPLCDEHGQAPPGAGSQLCLPQDWGPVQGGCAAGFKERYKRCWFYAPEWNISKYCAASALPESQKDDREVSLIPQESRLANCAVCPDSSPDACVRCAASASGLFEPAGDGSCTNTEPLLQLKLLLTVKPRPGEERWPFEHTSFWQLSDVVQEATKSNAWAFQNGAYLVDVYRRQAPTSDVPAFQARDHLVDVFRQEAGPTSTITDYAEGEDENVTTTPLPKDAEQWVFVVAVKLGSSSVHLQEVDLGNMGKRGSQDLVAALEDAFQAEQGPRACGDCSFEVLEDGRLFCAGMQPWRTCASWRGRLDSETVAWCLTIALGIATVLCGGAVLLRRFGKRREEGALQRGVELQSRV